MADLVNIITWPEVDVTPLDDALVYETAIGEGGVIYGLGVTLKSSNTLHVEAGHAVVCGRKLTVVEGDVAIPLSTSENLQGRIYLQLDLSNVTTPASIQTEVAGQLTPPVQDADVNITNGTYEIDLYHFTVSSSTIYGLTKVFDPIAPPGELRQLLDLSHTQFLKTLGINWTLISGGTWDGYYRQTLNLTAIYNGAGDVDARGATLATPPSDEVKAAVSQMYFLVDDVAMTLTAYTKTAPTVACNISVEGMV